MGTAAGNGAGVMSAMQPLVAPFPWFGGKRTVTAEVWARLGNVTNYVEPFFGSGAILLGRPHEGKTETVNDADHFIANFWRACREAPSEVADHADSPVNEADLQARHWWLITEGRARIAKCAGEPNHYDAQVAGWWVWGACAWIGSGWCVGQGPWTWNGAEWSGGNAGQGLNRQLPHLGDAGRDLNRKLPHLGDAGRGLFVQEWISALAKRLRDVRVACGDWSRVCGDSVTHRHGLTGVFLDPPYGVDDRATVYSHDCRNVAAEARMWAIDIGQRKDMRVAFAGYDGEHEFPVAWSAWRWKARGGYGSQGNEQGRANAGRETIWFSPACINAAQSGLFDYQRASAAAEMV